MGLIAIGLGVRILSQVYDLVEFFEIIVVLSCLYQMIVNQECAITGSRIHI